MFYWTPDTVDQLAAEDFRSLCGSFAKMHEKAAADEREAASLKHQQHQG